MQFDSRLVILVSNTDPDTLANTAGLWARDAIYDRLMGSRAAIRGGIFCPDKFTARETLKNKLIQLCVRVLRDIDIYLVAADIAFEMEDDVIEID